MIAGVVAAGTAVPASPRVLLPLELAPRPTRLGAVVHDLDGRSMGTGWSLRFVGHPRQALEPVRRAVEEELDGVVRQMSPWLEDSDISRYNRAPAGQWQSLPPAFAEVLACALAVAASSAGAFDPAAGALVAQWGFGPQGPTRLANGEGGPAGPAPSAASIRAARERGSWRHLDFDTAGARLRQPGGLQLDLCAVAKGHAVDRVAARLDAEGIEHHLVEIGGELRGSGQRADGQPWWVDIERPPVDAQAQGLPMPVPTRLALHGLSIATSGDYRCWAVGPDGARRSHTIDPRDGQPVSHGLASVSVVHGSCMWADALSTALMVLGPRDGPAWAREQGVAALLLMRRDDGGFDEWLSPALQALAA